MMVLYECDRKQCGARCSYPTCKHTTKIEHAVRLDVDDSDFEIIGGMMWQKIKDTPPPSAITIPAGR